MMGDVAPGAAAQVELLDAPPSVAERRERDLPERPGVGFLQDQIDEVRDRSALDREGAVHIGFAKLEIRIEQHRPLGRGGRKPHRHRRPGAVAERIGHAAGAGDL
jgi:hypothetical protein